nr:DUF2249 domain-containing protein [Salibacterium aidingense]
MKLNNRGLEPPQPMVRTLDALERLGDHQSLIIINDRKPMFLYPELEERGYSHDTVSLEDGSYQITIRKKT